MHTKSAALLTFKKQGWCTQTNNGLWIHWTQSATDILECDRIYMCSFARDAGFEF